MPEDRHKAKIHRAFRISEEAYTAFQKYQQDHKFKAETEAMEDILLNLHKPQPQSDVPIGNPTNLLDPSFPPEILEARKVLVEASKRMELHQPKPPECPFCAKISETEIECGKALKKGKKPMRMATASCWACYERREYVKRKVEKQKENEAEQKRTQPPQPQKRESRSVEGSTEFRGYLREWNCRKLEREFSYVKTSELKDKLPCLQDPAFVCDMKLQFSGKPTQTSCRTLIMKKIDLEAPELIKEIAKKTMEALKQSA